MILLFLGKPLKLDLVFVVGINSFDREPARIQKLVIKGILNQYKITDDVKVAIILNRQYDARVALDLGAYSNDAELQRFIDSMKVSISLFLCMKFVFI